ncbi:MAG: HAMP domain-containing sensor histidine kinase [Bacteroidales bacterium]
MNSSTATKYDFVTRGRMLYYIAIVSLVVAVIAESVYSGDLEKRFRTKLFSKTLERKELLTNDCLNSLKAILDKGEDIGSISKSELFEVMRHEDITILYYLDNKLVHWSDNSFTVPEAYDENILGKPFVFIHNGWFISRSISDDKERLIALLRIRNEFDFENDLVRNGFVSDFKVPDGTGMALDKSKSDFTIQDQSGKFLFSLVFPESGQPSWFIIIPLALWFIFLALLLVLTERLTTFISGRGKRMLAVLTGFAIPLICYSFIVLTRKPATFYQTGLFSPYLYSGGSFIPSLGNLLILAVFLAFFSSILFRQFPARILKSDSSTRVLSILTLLIIPANILLSLANYVFTDLVSNTTINFEPFRVLDLSFYSFAGYLSVLLLLVLPVIYLFALFRNNPSVKPVPVLISSLFSLLVFVPFTVKGPDQGIVLMLFSFSVIILIWLSASGRLGKFNMTVVLSLLTGLYSLYFILELSEVKNIENKKVLAVAYSSEHDPEAEHQLLDLWPRLSQDTVLRKMLSLEMSEQSDVDKIYSYLQTNYFNGYLANFNLNVVICRNDWTLTIASEETMADNCFQFFNDRIKKDGQKLTGTDFYFLDNQWGRPFYVGQLFYPLSGTYINGLFLELYSNVDAVQAGYSELLLDKKYQGYEKLGNYSFAKYINGFLVFKNGEFPYNKTDDEYVEKMNDYRVFNRESFKHVLYKNGNITVIISEPRLSNVEVLISFAYLFALTLLVSNLIVIFLNRPTLKSLMWFNFRQKLQIAFIGILLFSFITVGILVAVFSVRQYQSRHLENIKEKIGSVYIELEGKFSLEPKITPDWRDESDPTLNELLIRLSNVFNTDINLYDKRGYLMATSRPEIFFRDLTSKRLNMDAFINLETLTKPEYIQKEKVASLEYLSAYVPFYNKSNELLAYLNLPYFRMQSVLARDISNVIVAVVNFTLLLIVFTMSIAVIISGRLTSPLRMLSEGLASVELGKRSKHLSYTGHDEISDMVKQYNRMVDELQESAEKLANSEREYAWREMAKQVAHEIKNPLTPMKLNVQQLFKSWKDGIPGFEKKLERFTKNQIEFIDTLSAIASAFSSFAKMPTANPVEVDLLEQMKTTLELFKNTDNTTFRVNWPHERKIIVFADKEHLNGIFSNLIKNAIQSVPQGQEGIIRINTELEGDKVVISVADNGTGIPEELKKNLFTPNFTTKSSGMGLGLSIVKRYTETANGRVWFESETGKGSVFFVELPIHFTVERL